ncbi:MAG: beta-ketoacyl-[acyl-carrier-protein] synthase family protein [Bacteroidetes bacterium]|jgi:3-oxoacyl-[acyl-carrier-protein] synthase-1|nr:beta-ketoacyl-[acyl-carrier-protein] synthase family protein [Bacteroidota bacterium]MDF2451103.1 beta-ketoacyl-[acyl-carrier-protein] synthase family protein [Bacteroidota bacterium]
MISAIGNNVPESFLSLTQSKTGIGKIHHLTTRYKDEFLAGEIKLSNSELADLVKDNNPALNRNSYIAMLAAKEAVINSGIDTTDGLRTGVISSTTVAGMSKTELYYKELFEKDDHLDVLDTHDCGDSTERIADYLGNVDYVTTISTACSSAANAIMLGCRMIKHGQLDRVVVGGVDALSKFTFNGFNTLMILDREWCKPFDENRKGLNLGEGAAFVVIEGENALNLRKGKALAEIIGYANTNDAYHQTASSPEGYGATMAIQQALEMSGLKPTDVDYINMHGTGTPNNDLSESKATIAVFGNQVPKFSSTKAFTGHTLAAAASIEAVISVLSLQNSMIFPNLNFTTPIIETGLIPETKLVNIPLNTILSNSFGFGGNCSSLLFKKV